MEKLKEEYAKAKTAHTKAESLVSEALRREKNLEREVERLRAQSGEVPSLKTQLAEAQASVAQMLAQVDQLVAQSVEKDKEIENMQAASLEKAQELATVKGNLFWEQQTRRYLMTSGISEIVSKVRTSHEYGKFVAKLVPAIQAWGKTELIKKMRHDYFPHVRPEDVPYFVQNAEEEAESAFQRLRSEPFECNILTKLAANLDMSEKEIRELENPDLLSG